MRGRKGRQQAPAVEHFQRLCRAGGGGILDCRVILERHAGAGVDEQSHAGGKHNLMLAGAFKIEIGRCQSGQRSQPQGGQQHAHPAGQFRCIPAVHPEHDSRHTHQRQHQQGHLPPLRKALDQPAFDMVLHPLGSAEQGRQGQQAGKGVGHGCGQRPWGRWSSGRARLANCGMVTGGIGDQLLQQQHSQ